MLLLGGIAKTEVRRSPQLFRAVVKISSKEENIHKIVNKKRVQKQTCTSASTWVLMKAWKVLGRAINTVPKAELIFAEGKQVIMGEKVNKL